MPVHPLASHGASLCIAIAGVLAIKPSRVLGAVRFNRIHMLIMAVGFFVVEMIYGGLPTLTTESPPVALISVLVTIFPYHTFLLPGSAELDRG